MPTSPTTTAAVCTPLPVHLQGRSKGTTFATQRRKIRGRLKLRVGARAEVLPTGATRFCDTHIRGVAYMHTTVEAARTSGCFATVVTRKGPAPPVGLACEQWVRLLQSTYAILAHRDGQ